MTKKIPLPIVGVILGLFALGNLIQTYSETLRLVLGGIGAVLLVLFLIRMFSNLNVFKEEMKNPVMASVFGTFSMALMLFAGYLKPYIGESSKFVYYLGIIIHIIIIIYFTAKFIFNYDIKKVFASYYIVYVGIVVGSVVAPAFGAQKLGQAFFWFGLISFIILLFTVNQRYTKIGHPDAPLAPLFCITCAPASLLLAGYMQSFEEKNLVIVYGLMIVSQLLYIYVLTKLPAYLKETKFFPSYAAFTFPFVITGIGLKMATGFLTKSGNIEKLGFLKAVLPKLVLIETIIAAILVIYALIRYIGHFVSTEAN
ncbi:TDT family transporter [Lagierella sp.]|uniref:TDT family transporter n=1 Tax=Lagierella sp. TaxID=2849657 RepID=UPI002624682C|nr:TDT family transporter [Lagierella sp.]